MEWTMSVARLEPKERVALDRGPIEEMCRTLGLERAEVMVGGAMEELAVWLSRAEKLRRSGQREELGRLVTRIGPVAERLGMPLLGQMARELRVLCATADDAALAAVTGRMVRIGEASLVAIWDLQDLSG
jgi:hypothetical protein